MTTERIADHVKFAYWVPNVSGGLVTVRRPTGTELADVGLDEAGGPLV